MAMNIKKYNPGFLSDENLISSFCIRIPQYESIMETLYDNVKSSNTHVIVIGPRGSGKTHLLLRVVAQIRQDDRLASVFPIVFPEESYEIATTGEFWLECLSHLVQQAPVGERDSLERSYEEIRRLPINDDNTLAHHCLAVLVGFAARYDLRLLLVVENLNMLFDEIGDPDAGWKLRQTLQIEPRIMLLGSATSRFSEIDHPDHALYDLFRVITLAPLDTNECKNLWRTLSGNSTEALQIRPLQILTGGNPRLLAVLAGFEEAHSFQGLMFNLLNLVDDHTDYFKSHLEALAPQERRTYVALARLWKPATTTEIAFEARLDINKCSAQLKRLVDRGAVSIDGGTKRRHLYYLTERLYNIYYLLRRPGSERRVVEALIHFMAGYYSPEELIHIGVQLARDAEGGDLRIRETQILAFRILLQLPELDSLLVDLLTDDSVTGAFSAVQAPDIVEPMANALLIKARSKKSEGCLEEALACCDEIIRMADRAENDNLLVAKGIATLHKLLLLNELGRNDDAVAFFGSAFVERDQNIDAGTVEAIVREFIGDGDIMAHPIASVFRAFTFLTFRNLNKAADELESAIQGIGDASNDRDSILLSVAISLKGLVLAVLGSTINDDDVGMLLPTLVSPRTTPFPSLTLRILIQYAAGVEPSKALTLIANSPAAEFLQPLIVALRQELGEEPSVAREIDEVSQDVRRTLAHMRSERANRQKST